MTRASTAINREAIREKLIVALDVSGADEARRIAGELQGRVGAFKIGLQLFTSAGPAFVREMVAAGHRIFLDLKFHDIPNTVAKASVEATRMGAWMFNVHAAGGAEMMRAAREAIDEITERESLARPIAIAVTALTSIGEGDLVDIGIAGPLDDHILLLAATAAKCGMDGVVASPNELTQLKGSPATRDLITVTPGIRAADATNHDQRRVNTFGRAIAAGSDYLVVGRAITEEVDMIGAVDRLLAEADNA